MNIVYFNELGADIRADMQGARWLLMTHEDLNNATAALMFSEMEDVLVAVDHRGAPVEDGLWMRAVHLLLVLDPSEAADVQARSGVTRVLASEGEMEDHLW